MRTYQVWIKGKRITTEATVTAETKMNAIASFAWSHGLKTFECDGMWVRK